MKFMVGVAQLVRALGCGLSGRGFESLHSPLFAPVAQLDRASDFESAGRPFESGRACKGPLAQSAEQLTLNQ